MAPAFWQVRRRAGIGEEGSTPSWPDELMPRLLWTRLGRSS